MDHGAMMRVMLDNATPWAVLDDGWCDFDFDVNGANKTIYVRARKGGTEGWEIDSYFVA